MSKQPFEIVNEIGFDAYLEMARKVEANQSILPDQFSSLAMACTISLANALAPAIEAANDRDAAAEMLVDSCIKRLREFIQPAIHGNG
jgi:hypothetical protein